MEGEMKILEWIWNEEKVHTKNNFLSFGPV